MPLKSLFIFLIVFLIDSNVSRASDPVDLRILVDVSGSMKKNDPKHLRRPAVKLMTGMLPEDAFAGISLFGEEVASLIPATKANQKWKKNAREAASRIHDNDKFTNMGAALESAIKSWESAGKVNKNLKRMAVLLTDGMVDISKDAEVNKVERERIQNQLIPRLQSLNAKVYTIALSDGADKELLAQISNSTNAWFESVKNADDLEKVFLKIFEQSVPVPSLPISDNRFKIDPSVKEYTALIFKKGSEAIQLIDPDGKIYEAESISSNLTWFQDENFDLVTFKNPKSGEWSIVGPVDPSNRVLVVSDLKLKINNDELPAAILGGDELIFKVSLTEKDIPISRPTFLKLVTFLGTISSNPDINEELFLEDQGKDGDEKAGDGIYSAKFVAAKVDAEVAFDIQVVSPTFERIIRKNIRIYSKFFNLEGEAAKSLLDTNLFKVSAVPSIINPDSMKVTGIVTLPTGEEMPLTFEENKQKIWTAQLTPNKQGGKLLGRINIDAKTLNGRDIKLENQVISILSPTFMEEVVAPPEEAKTEAKAEEKKQPDAATETPTEENKPVEKPKKGMALIWWIVLGILFNVIVFGGGYYAWILMKKKKQQAAEKIASELNDE